jgi:UDP-N-acetylmuramate--alanine ligase
MQDFIHFIGIGGIGVSALAQMAQARGARVSGSDTGADPASNPALARLIEGGAIYYCGHCRENIAGPSSAHDRQSVTLVVATAAVRDDNPEIVEARERGIRVVSRAAYLGELMTAHRGPKIAVAGTHGKTTTTGLIGVMLWHAGLDPTVFVGGEVAQLGGNVRIGCPDGPFVAEACEAYDSFIHLKPDIAVVTNVEADHLDYYGTEAGVFAAFARFLSGVRSGGSIVVCGDDAGVRRLMSRSEGCLSARQVTYGIESTTADVRARTIELGEQPAFLLSGPWVNGMTPVRLSVPGHHNIENALASASVGTLLGLSSQEISHGLAAFHGAGRRQELLGEVSLREGAALVMDDYAHHPTEITATLDALRSAYPGRRLIAVFQPHLYSRTRDFLPEFANALARADALIVTDIYAARESPIDGVRAEDIVTLARTDRPGLDARFVSDKREIPAVLDEIVEASDLVVFMGAGDIRVQGEAFVNRRSAAGAAA